MWKIFKRCGWLSGLQWPVLIRDKVVGLLVPLQLMDGVSTAADFQPAPPLRAVSVVNDGFDRSVGH